MPVISNINDKSSAISKWSCRQLQKPKHYIPSYIRALKHLKEELEGLGKLASNTKIFTAGSVLMYTYANMDHVIDTIEPWFKEF